MRLGKRTVRCIPFTKICRVHFWKCWNAILPCFQSGRLVFGKQACVAVCSNLAWAVHGRFVGVKWSLTFAWGLGGPFQEPLTRSIRPGLNSVGGGLEVSIVRLTPSNESEIKVKVIWQRILRQMQFIRLFYWRAVSSVSYRRSDHFKHFFLWLWLKKNNGFFRNIYPLGALYMGKKTGTMHCS